MAGLQPSGLAFGRLKLWLLPIDEYPTALSGLCSCGDKAGVPAAMGPPVLLPPAGLPHECGSRSQFLAQVDGAHFWCRFPILTCHVMYVTTTTMSVEDVSLSAGQLPRPFSTGSTPQRVMCGAMGW